VDSDKPESGFSFQVVFEEIIEIAKRQDGGTDLKLGTETYLEHIYKPEGLRLEIRF